MNGFVYIAQTKNGSYYIGSSIDVEKRILEHNQGRTNSLKFIRPVKLLFKQKFESIKLARQVEYKLNLLKSRKILEQTILNNRIDIDKLL